MTLQASSKQATLSVLAWYGMAPAALSADPMAMPPRAHALNSNETQGVPWALTGTAALLGQPHCILISLWAYTWEVWGPPPRHVS